ncbi:hypothetical protein, variant [Capsaspora owczarzaki ATCC 30864]|uniref:NOD3 protein n=1 Tax=Capsaspora owczarzaki (strain ATCC 30864) TaxID=595528 RepID=A0A0D2WX30_CAPO3|nr:hypothetical protein, variant [Capsaspora owczarzaki ATCC 30864]
MEGGTHSLGKNRIGDAGATAIAEALQASTALIHLYLVENQIGDAGAQAIAEGLNGNTRLTGLYLYQNEFGDAGAQAMAQALKVNTTLTWLSLRANQIGDAGAQAVAEALRVNKKLTWLDLQYNCIGNVTVQVIGETRKATRPKIDIDNQINPRVFSLFPRLASADDIQDVFRLLTCGPELDNQSASLPALTSEIVHFIMDEAHYWQGVKHAKRALFDGTLPDCILKVTLPQSINGCSIRVKAIQVLRNKKERRDSIDDGVFDLIVRDENGAVRYECAANPNVVDSNIARATILPSSTPIIEHMREGWHVQVRSSKSAQDVLLESLYVGYV